MKITTLAVGVLLLTVFSAYSQNLHNSSNAASIENESDTTTGWTSPASLTSTDIDAQNGSFCLRIATQGNQRDARYNFQAQVGAVYNISIWARRTENSNNPAFANWSGMSGFTTTLINSQTWTQYNFTVTATQPNPMIRIYAGPIGAQSGADVLVDAVSIFPDALPDTDPPTAPSGLAATSLTENSATITWNASTDSVGVTGYTVRQDGLVVATTDENTLEYLATGLTPSTTYSYYITAFDAMNNISPSSDTLEITTLDPPVDSIAPSIPTGLAAANIGPNGFTLMWDPSTDNFGVTSYLIYRDSLAPVSTGGNIPSLAVSGLLPSTNYSMRVAALDAAGNMSELSDTLIVLTTDSAQIIDYTSDNANLPTIDWQSNNFYAAGRIGIGTSPSATYRLSVNGNIRAKEIIVESGWSDFVFDPGYYLAPLEEVEAFILANRHLKDIPSERDVRQNGIGLAEMNTLLLQKVEEITLYLIQANKRIKELENYIISVQPAY